MPLDLIVKWFMLQLLRERWAEMDEVTGKTGLGEMMVSAWRIRNKE